MIALGRHSGQDQIKEFLRQTFRNYNGSTKFKHGERSE